MTAKKRSKKFKDKDIVVVNCKAEWVLRHIFGMKAKGIGHNASEIMRRLMLAFVDQDSKELEELVFDEERQTKAFQQILQNNKKLHGKN